MKKTNNQGITLIALVITIIVLLILAGVSIAMLTGGNGVLTKASEADLQNARGEACDRINVVVNGVFSDILSNRSGVGTLPTDKDSILKDNGLKSTGGIATEAENKGIKGKYEITTFDLESDSDGEVFKMVWTPPESYNSKETIEGSIEKSSTDGVGYKVNPAINGSSVSTSASSASESE